VRGSYRRLDASKVKPYRLARTRLLLGHGYVEPPGYFLERDGDMWMSTSRLERESHAIHVKHATGNVVVCGVGMGMYLFNIAGLDRVERIVAVELDSSRDRSPAQRHRL
jgi:hypothetical protein